VGWGHALHGGVEKRIALVRRSIDIRRRIGDKIGESNALRNLATAEWNWLGRRESGTAYIRESRRLVESMGDQAGVTWNDFMLVWMFVGGGQIAEARKLTDSAVRMAFDLQIPTLVNMAKVWLAYERWSDGKPREALALLDETFRLEDGAIPDAGVVAFHTWVRSLIYCELRDFAAARRYVDYTIEYFSRGMAQASLTVHTWYLAQYALIVEAEGQSDIAALLLSIALHYPMRDNLWVDDWQPARELRTRLEKSLGQERFSAAWERGQDPTLTVSDFEALVSLRKGERDA
jgi:hypothetical protein